MALAPCETDELVRVVFHDKRDVRCTVCTENPLPLTLTNKNGGSATVCCTKGLHVQRSQQCHVSRRRFDAS